MKKLLIVLLLILSIAVITTNAKDFKSISFSNFVQLVSNTTKKNIVISDNINKDFQIYLPDYNFQDSKQSINLLKNILELNSLDYKNVGNVILIFSKKEVVEDVPKPDEPKNLYYIALDNLVYEDVSSLISLYEIQPKYIKTTNSIVYRATEKQNEKIQNALKKIDYKLEQIQFKITVLETKLGDLKERGTELSAYMQSNNYVSQDSTQTLPYNYFLNLITMPYSATTNVLSNSKKGFYTVLHYLNSHNFTTIKNSPILTAKSNKKVSFSSVRNIPYLVEQKEIVDNKSSVSSSYEYRDVGLKIDIQPVVLKDYISFSLNLSIEDIISTNSLTPETTKRKLVGNYSLKKGELLVLSGINRETEFTSIYGVPILKDVYILGNLFKYKSNSKENSVLTITIEVM
ncbi:type II secretion system protein GspD [Sulfurospirillum sp. 1307]